MRLWEENAIQKNYKNAKNMYAKMQKCVYSNIFRGLENAKKMQKNVFAYFSLPWSSPIYRIYRIHIVVNCLCESGCHNKVIG